MNNKKQSSIDWLISCITEDQMVKSKSLNEWLEIFEQAKAMHKEEMRELYLAHVTKVPRLKKIFEKQFEEYYTNTFE